MRPPDIDYENEEKLDWMQYLDQFYKSNEEHSRFVTSEWDKTHHMSDDELRTEIIQKLYNSEGVDASQIRVEVVSGRVLLAGEVRSEVEKSDAMHVAEEVPGVWSIQNELTVLE